MEQSPPPPPPERLKDILLKDLSPNKIKAIVSGFYLKSYIITY